jgi:hypothetical protein
MAPKLAELGITQTLAGEGLAVVVGFGRAVGPQVGDQQAAVTQAVPAQSGGVIF